MDAFYQEAERILGHAADPYHRIDVRRSSRNLVVRDGDEIVADTHAPLVLHESGFAPRWYIRRAEIVADALEPVEGQTVCPYKGLASYCNVGEHGPPPGPTALRSRKRSASQTWSPSIPRR